MRKGSFFTRQPIFNQVLKLIPRSDIHSVSRQLNADYYCKKFTTCEHLVTMLYGILNKCEFLLEVTTRLPAWDQRIHHSGINNHPGRSTVSDANKRRNEVGFEKIYYQLLVKYRHILPDSQKRSKKNNLYIFDSTTVS